MFNMDGRLLYQHHYEGSFSGSCKDVIDFFLTNEVECVESDIIKIDKQRYNTLITDTHTDLKYLYKYCRGFENIERTLAGNTQKEIRYVCSIFTLSQLYGIETNEVSTTFYLRYGIVDDNDKHISYYDVEYYDDESEGFWYVDEYILSEKM